MISCLHDKTSLSTEGMAFNISKQPLWLAVGEWSPISFRLLHALRERKDTMHLGSNMPWRCKRLRDGSVNCLRVRSMPVLLSFPRMSKSRRRERTRETWGPTSPRHANRHRSREGSLFRSSRLFLVRDALERVNRGLENWTICAQGNSKRKTVFVDASTDRNLGEKRNNEMMPSNCVKWSAISGPRICKC